MSETVSNAKGSCSQSMRHTLHQRETAHPNHPTRRETKCKENGHQPQLQRD